MKYFEVEVEVESVCQQALQWLEGAEIAFY